MEVGQTLKVRRKTHGSCNNPSKLIVRTYIVVGIYPHIVSCRKVKGNYPESFQRKEIKEHDGILYIDIMNTSQIEEKERLARKQRKASLQKNLNS